MVSAHYDCQDHTQLLSGMRHARQAIERGECVVMPTDTVYGIAVNAFSPDAVTTLLSAKGRSRQSPPPVLVPGEHTMQALVSVIPDEISELIHVHWPGGLTIVLPAQPSLSWDLGDTKGTVAVRMPAHRLALELLEDTGPLAVSSANLTAQPAAQTAAEAEHMLGDRVAVYLDDGPVASGLPSTIIDATGLVTMPKAHSKHGQVRILRDGVITRQQLSDVLGEVLAES